MASTATLILTGVVYFSALPPLPQQQPLVLKASVMLSSHDRVSTHGGAIPRHISFIKVRKDQVHSVSGRTPDLEYMAIGETVFTYIFFLKGEEVEIEGASNTKLEFPTPVVPPDPTPSTKAPFETAVARVQDFCPTCRLLTPSDFDSPDVRHVGARLNIKVGSVTAQALSPCRAWNFDAEFGYSSHVENMMARQVAVDLAVPSQLSLKTTPLPGSKVPPSTITFVSGIPVEVTVGSATLEDILNVGTHGVDRVDHHFELYYYLLERSNKARHPLPIADPSCAKFHRLNGVDCPPVQQ